MKFSSLNWILVAFCMAAISCANTGGPTPQASSEPAAEPTPKPVVAPTPTKDRSAADGQLIAAVGNAELAAVKAAVTAGASINAKDDSGFTVLVNAMANGDFEVVDFLIQHGAETGLKKPDVESVNRVLGDGLAQDELLLAAAETGDFNAVKRLVEAGANVNARSEDGFTVLVHAISGYHREVIQYLIQKGATIHP